MNPDRLLSIAALMLCVGLVAHAFSVESRLGTVKAELAAAKVEVEAIRKDLAEVIRKNNVIRIPVAIPEAPSTPGF